MPSDAGRQYVYHGWIGVEHEITHQDSAAVGMEVLHEQVGILRPCIGIQPGHELPLLDGLEVVLSLDDHELVLPDGSSEILKVFVCKAQVSLLHLKRPAELT